MKLPQCSRKVLEVGRVASNLRISQGVKAHNRGLAMEVSAGQRPVGNLRRRSTLPELLEHDIVRGEKPREVVVDVEVAGPLVVDVVDGVLEEVLRGMEELPVRRLWHPAPPAASLQRSAKAL